MKTVGNNAKTAGILKRALLLFISLLLANFSRSQTCNNLQYTYDLSAATGDTSVTTISQSRFGQCCGAATNTNCVTFFLKVRPGNQTISLSGSNVTGADQVAVDCGTLYTASNICMSATTSTVSLTNCKPGNNPEFFVVTIRKQGNAGSDIYLRSGCSATLTASNTTTPVWTSIYPGAAGAYNSYLSCTSCMSPTVTPTGTPAVPAGGYIDYKLTSTNCFGTNITDTVRVNFVSAPTVLTSPSQIRVCSGTNNQPFTAIASGGVAPYKYTWSNGSTNASITPTALGTYTVSVTDRASTCGAITATCILSGSATNSGTFSYPGSPYCKTASNPFPVFSAGSTAGTFTVGAGLNFVNTATGQVNIATSSPGTYTITNTIPSTNGCAETVSTNTITLLPVPEVSNSNATICNGHTLNISLTANTSSTYTWIAGNNLNTTGESTTLQNTGTISDVLTNLSNAVQTVSYTVVPTSSPGSCLGTSKVIDVAVIPEMVVSVSPNSPELFNDSITLTATVDAGSPSYTYVWENSSDEVVGTAPAYTATEPGTYKVQICNESNTSCNTFQFVTVNLAPLPIELLHFNATYNEKTVHLEWETASEINNNYFTVERSIDLIHFETVCFNIPSKAPGGNSTSRLSYTLTDKQVSPGAIYYYRLKQTDHNGKYNYSDIVNVEVEEDDDFHFEVSPNPCDGKGFNSIITSGKEEEVLIVVYDVWGTQKFSKVIITEQMGNTVYAMDLDQKLNAGVYLITATSNQKMHSKRMVVN